MISTAPSKYVTSLHLHLACMCLINFEKNAMHSSEFLVAFLGHLCERIEILSQLSVTSDQLSNKIVSLH